MVDTLTQVPTTLIAGDSFAWERELPDYPAGTWVLTYYFDSPTNTFQVVADVSGTTHSVSVAVATTAAYGVGRYRWHARVSEGAIAKTIESGWLEVLPNPAVSTATDWRSHARKMVDAIEAALEGQATKNQLDLISYSIGGSVNVTRDRDLLVRLRDKYRWEAMNEEGSAGASNPRHLYLRFGRP